MLTTKAGKKSSCTQGNKPVSPEGGLELGNPETKKGPETGTMGGLSKQNT